MINLLSVNWISSAKHFVHDCYTKLSGVATLALLYILYVPCINTAQECMCSHVHTLDLCSGDEGEVRGKELLSWMDVPHCNQRHCTNGPTCMHVCIHTYIHTYRETMHICTCVYVSSL